MTRRCWIILALACGGCRQASPEGASLLPAAVAQVWQRKSLREIQPHRFKALYEGRGTLTAEVYVLPASAMGLDMAQRRKPTPNSVFFYKGNYFAVVKWDRADREALTAFVRGLEKALPEK